MGITSHELNKHFLEDEVRLGFYIPATIKQAWAAQLEVLKVIDNICRKCNIRYFADWGTFLGTVRHHGYIPWDDDMDIVMIRDDYDRFFEEAPKYFPEGYSIHTFRNEEGFREFHAVVVNTPSARFDKEHFDKFHGFNYLCGIDIFVLDYLYEDAEKEDIRDKDAVYLISLADSIIDDNIPNDTIRANLKHVEGICNRRFAEDLRLNSPDSNTIFYSLASPESKKDLWVKLYELADKKCAEVSKESSDTLTQMVPWGLKKDLNRRYPKEMYDNSLRLPFENTDIPVPLFYNRLLKQRYGNYMTIHKAGGAHEYPFFEKQKNDLEELLGKKFSDYSFKSEYLTKDSENNDSFKNLLSEGLGQLAALDMQKEDDICSAQELAIDIGTMIENVKGDDHPSIPYINTYCENLYHLYNNSLDDPSIVKRSFDEMRSYISTEILAKKTAVFLPFKSDAWNAFEDIYDSLCDNDGFEVYVVPIPYYFKEFDGTLSDEQYDIDSYPEYLNTFSYEDFPLEFLHPEFIFIQNPYDEFNVATSIHPEFYASKIKNLTDKLIYVPWFKTCEIDESDLRACKNMQYYVTVPGVVNSDLVLLKTKQEQKMYIRKLSEWSSSSDVWDSKICLLNAETLRKLGINLHAKHHTSSMKSVLYYVGAGQAVENADVFLDKFRSNTALFKENEDKLKLTHVIDHLLEDTIKIHIPKIYEIFKKEIAALTVSGKTNILYDCEPLSVLTSCDAYYGDASFLACEYSRAHKPVMIQKYI